MKATYCVFNKRNETFLGINVSRAASMAAHLRGLLSRFTIAPGGGIWVVPSRGMHTLGLLVPVDVIYLDSDNRVIHLIEHMSPFRLAPLRLNCASVLQMAAHTIYISQTQIGDQLFIGLPEDLKLHLNSISGGVAAGSSPKQSLGRFSAAGAFACSPGAHTARAAFGGES